jgi:hypothetical protein
VRIRISLSKRCLSRDGNEHHRGAAYTDHSYITLINVQYSKNVYR